jgi:hypothetical protein
MVNKAESRETLLLASQNYEKLKGRGHRDTGFSWRVEQAVLGGVINLDDDLAKCLTDERRSFLLKKMGKGQRHWKKQAKKQAKKSQPGTQPPVAGSKRNSEGTVIQSLQPSTQPRPQPPQQSLPPTLLPPQPRPRAPQQYLLPNLLPPEQAALLPGAEHHQPPHTTPIQTP